MDIHKNFQNQHQITHNYEQSLTINFLEEKNKDGFYAGRFRLRGYSEIKLKSGAGYEIRNFHFFWGGGGGGGLSPTFLNAPL